MLEVTKNLIRGVLDTDSTMDGKAKGCFMQMVSDFSGSPDRCVTNKEAARRLGCSVDMVRYMRRKGLLDGVRFSGERYRGVTEESLSAHINAMRGAPKPALHRPGRPKKNKTPTVAQVA